MIAGLATDDARPRDPGWERALYLLRRYFGISKEEAEDVIPESEINLLIHQLLADLSGERG